MNRYGQTRILSPPLRAPFASLFPFAINQSAAPLAESDDGFGFERQVRHAMP